MMLNGCLKWECRGLLQELSKLREGSFTALVLTQVLTPGQARRHWALGSLGTAANSVRG